MSSNKGKKIIFRIVDVTIWLAASITAFYLFVYGTPYKNGFFCNDKSLSYPSIQETISTPVLVAIGFTVSVLLVFSVEILNCLENISKPQCQSRQTITFLGKNYLVFLIGFLIQSLFVDAIKNTMGMLRPSFFDVCKPRFNTTLCPGYILEYTCAGNDVKEIRSSRQSFPSGHSSFSMYIAIYFIIYIEHRLQIGYSKMLKLFLQTSLIFAAIVCGLGRIKENKHHSSDVIAGFILGTTVAIYVQYMLGKKIVQGDNCKCADLQSKEERCSCADLQSKEETCSCCSFKPQADNDLQIPSPVLARKYFKTFDSGRNTSSTKLLAFQNNNDQNDSLTPEII